jgi:hypothetical protein
LLPFLFICLFLHFVENVWRFIFHSIGSLLCSWFIQV